MGKMVELCENGKSCNRSEKNRAGQNVDESRRTNKDGRSGEEESKNKGKAAERTSSTEDTDRKVTATSIPHTLYIVCLFTLLRVNVCMDTISTDYNDLQIMLFLLKRV